MQTPFRIVTPSNIYWSGEDSELASPTIWQYVNNTRTSHNFKFDGVLGEKATQASQEDTAIKNVD